MFCFINVPYRFARSRPEASLYKSRYAKDKAGCGALAQAFSISLAAVLTSFRSDNICAAKATPGAKSGLSPATVTAISRMVSLIVLSLRSSVRIIRCASAVINTARRRRAEALSIKPRFTAVDKTSIASCQSPFITRARNNGSKAHFAGLSWENASPARVTTSSRFPPAIDNRTSPFSAIAFVRGLSNNAV